MSAFYIDNDVALSVIEFLTAEGHSVVGTRDGGLESASDDEQLLVATQQDRVFITHNERDFLLLHDAWQRWSDAWGVAVTHPGILVLPQGTRYGVFWDAERITQAILICLIQYSPVTNGLFRWKGSGWQRRIGRDWIGCS